jgi:hypothetical protein
VPKSSIILKNGVLALCGNLYKRGRVVFVVSNFGATTGCISVVLGTYSSQQDSGYNSVKYLHGLRFLKRLCRGF